MTGSRLVPQKRQPNQPRPKRAGDHKPTWRTRARACALAIARFDDDDIAELMGISTADLRRHYRLCLQEPERVMEAMMVEELAVAAKDSKYGAAVFFLKARRGWRDDEGGAIDAPPFTLNMVLERPAETPRPDIPGLELVDGPPAGTA